MAATPAQRLAVLNALDHEQKRVMDARAPAPLRKEAAAPALAHATGAASEAPPPHYFRMMKELALLGFFTSEVGCTQALRYIETPGRFDACIPYAPGEPAWASHA
jgi:hypothetical protein